ncbi:[SSU ribosomal protein S5P]-alanine acetyltransferase [Streptomyces puniciscabiei]|uniref:[SSU ribosomal protein S5P]-alanine acetyltransferase n=1 Tax=Streptomyces puniciscabiei TaxID=164348 RepID=A0A542SXG4_9ACTN|nr:GNAT family N-acetyltransferase [Streptomyces puniciscabiei]TQK79306.1 [SSU ribosomal protein S5P]-alanine acetyltransferase [Streptomyces puniciscabiei]
MDIGSEEIAGGVILRLAGPADAPALCTAYAENRKHLEPWQPRRPESFFTVAGQAQRLEEQERHRADGRLVPWLLEADGRVVGAITLSGIVMGAFCSSYLGYWVTEDQQGRGLATAAVERVCRIARDRVGLHRIEATTLPENTGSQRVLEKCGFEAIGMAPRYLHIDGQWRDHRMYQRVLHDDHPAL